MSKSITTLLLPIIITVFLKDIDGFRLTTGGALTNQQLPKSALTRLRELYGGCAGRPQGCFGFPENCINDFLNNANSTNPPVCRVFVSWAKQGDNNVFNMAGLPGSHNGYIALGLSEDASMGNDSVVGCYVTNGGAITISRYFNLAWNVGVGDPSFGLVAGPRVYDGGYIFCQFNQRNHEVNGVTIDFANRYHYLLAQGSMGGQAGLNKHPVDGKAPSPVAIHISDTGIVGRPRNETKSD